MLDSRRPNLRETFNAMSGAMPMGIRFVFDSSDAHQQLEVIAAQVLTYRTSDSELRAKSDSTAWSLAQCVCHLNKTSDAFLSLWHAVADAESGAIAGAPKPYSAMQRWMLWVMEPPYRMPMKTSSNFQPAEPASGLAELDHFAELQFEARDVVRRIAERNRTMVPVQSPFASWLNYPAGFSVDLFTSHQRRHLWQMRNISEALDRRG